MTIGELPRVRYSFLDGLTPDLVRPTVTHVHGELVARGRAVVALRESLLSGRVPEPDALDWPSEALRRPLLGGIARSGVAEFCAGDPRLTDEVVRFALDAIHESHRLEERAIMALSIPRPLPGDCGGGADGPGRDPDGWRKHRDAGMRLARDLAVELIAAKTASTWNDRMALWRELSKWLRELARAAGLPPGTERGLLRSLPLLDLARLRDLLAAMAPLGELIRTLGRLQEQRDGEGQPVLARIACSVARTRSDKRVEPLPSDGVQIRGIERGADLARMLPSEAALLAHPTLKRLWHARRAERALLGYHADGVLSERIRERQELEEDEASLARPVARGPIVVILDTSGSMQGVSEDLAKALVMQMLGVCFMEARRCHAYSFSGPGQVLEQELALDGDGLARVLDFLSYSFHGGTVPDEAIRRAVLRLDEASWHAADLVIVSDGEFVVDPLTHARLEALRARRDLRVHGLTVRGRAGFEQLRCDELHDLEDWIRSLRAAGGGS